MIVQCPHCGGTVVVNGLGRKRLNIPLKNVYECLSTTSSVSRTALFLGCSQSYIFAVLKAENLKLERTAAGKAVLVSSGRKQKESRLNGKTRKEKEKKMETKTKELIGQAEAIIDNRASMVEKGSCKTCLFCQPCDPSEMEWNEKLIAACAIQSFGGAIWFTQDVLDRAAFPSTCNYGDWTGIGACFACESNDNNAIVDKPHLINTHRDYMRLLAHMAELACMIRKVESGKAYRDLMEDIDSTLKVHPEAI